MPSACWPAAASQTFRAIHVEGPRAVAKAAREAGVRHLVHISAIGANAKSSSRYARSKAEGEAAVLQEFPGAIIVRPSIVFGPEDEFFNRFAAMARVSPLLPLIGRGRTRFQPVFVGDLAAAIAACASGIGKPGTIYEAGGPEVLSFRELLDLTQEWSDRSRGYLPMPFWLAKLQAILTWPLPNACGPSRSIRCACCSTTTSSARRLRAKGARLAALGVTAPHGVAAIVPTYLERFRAARAVRQLPRIAGTCRRKRLRRVAGASMLALGLRRRCHALSARWRSPGRRRSHGRSRPAACR